MHTPPKTVHEITRNQYNLLIPGQKLFYDSLITDGKVRIIDENTQAARTQPHLQQPRTPMRQQYPDQPDIISRLLNSKITVLLENGCCIEGILTETTNYELVLDNNIIILKHAVTTIQLASDNSNTPNIKI